MQLNKAPAQWLSIQIVLQQTGADQYRHPEPIMCKEWLNDDYPKGFIERMRVEKIQGQVLTEAGETFQILTKVRHSELARVIYADYV